MNGHRRTTLAGLLVSGGLLSGCVVPSDPIPGQVFGLVRVGPDIRVLVPLCPDDAVTRIVVRSPTSDEVFWDARAPKGDRRGLVELGAEDYEASRRWIGQGLLPESFDITVYTEHALAEAEFRKSSIPEGSELVTDVGDVVRAKELAQRLSCQRSG